MLIIWNLTDIPDIGMIHYKKLSVSPPFQIKSHYITIIGAMEANIEHFQLLYACFYGMRATISLSQGFFSRSRCKPSARALFT